MELNCPGKAIELPDEQATSHKQMETVNVFTLASNSYDDIVIFLYDHYKTRTEKAKTQQQQKSITVPNNSIDFSTNNAKFWLNKLKSKQKILDQYIYRNIDIDTLRWGLTNIQLIESLIKLDREKSSSE